MGVIRVRVPLCARIEAGRSPGSLPRPAAHATVSSRFSRPQGKSVDEGVALLTSPADESYTGGSKVLELPLATAAHLIRRLWYSSADRTRLPPWARPRAYVQRKRASGTARIDIAQGRKAIARTLDRPGTTGRRPVRLVRSLREVSARIGPILKFRGSLPHLSGPMSRRAIRFSRPRDRFLSGTMLRRQSSRRGSSPAFESIHGGARAKCALLGGARSVVGDSQGQTERPGKNPAR